jgi:hypothetical protein
MHYFCSRSVDAGIWRIIKTWHVKCNLYDRTLETRVRNFRKQVMCLGWFGREKRKHFKILKTTEWLSISGVFRSTAIRSRKSNFGRKFSVLCNKLRLVYIILKRLRFSSSTPAVVAETPVSKIWDGRLQTAHCGRTSCGIQHVTHDTAITVWCSIYTVHIQTIANIQHNTDMMKQTATVLYWTKWWRYSHDKARARSRFVSTEPKLYSRLRN